MNQMRYHGKNSHRMLEESARTEAGAHFDDGLACFVKRRADCNYRISTQSCIVFTHGKGKIHVIRRNEELEKSGRRDEVRQIGKVADEAHCRRARLICEQLS